MILENKSLSRSELVRKRRKANKKRLAQPVQRVQRPVVYKPMVKVRRSKGSSEHKQASNLQQRYNLAFSLGQAQARPSTVPLHRSIGARWLSGLMIAALGYALYLMWTSPIFNTGMIEISGNLRVGSVEIENAVNLSGRSIFRVIPGEITQNLLTNFPDFSEVYVQVLLPNRIVITLAERQPLIAWNRNGYLAWIDLQGVAFRPRGDVQGLIPVMALADPPPIPPDPEKPWITSRYIDQQMVQAISSLYPYLPADTALIYDAEHGLGWQDTRGWKVFFSDRADDIPMKLLAYQAIVDKLTGQGIQPSLISMEYLEHPFFSAQP